MTLQTTFYLSQILGKKCFSPTGTVIGKLVDVLIDQTTLQEKDIEPEPLRPRVVAAKIKKSHEQATFDFAFFEIKKFKRTIKVICHEFREIQADHSNVCLWLGQNILDKQIVDINGRKLVRVNDVRMVMIPSGTYAIAVDVGIEGLLRRIGIDRPIQSALDPLNFSIPGS